MQANDTEKHPYIEETVKHCITTTDILQIPSERCYCGENLFPAGED